MSNKKAPTIFIGERVAYFPNGGDAKAQNKLIDEYLPADVVQRSGKEESLEGYYQLSVLTVNTSGFTPVVARLDVPHKSIAKEGEPYWALISDTHSAFEEVRAISEDVYRDRSAETMEEVEEYCKGLQDKIAKLQKEVNALKSKATAPKTATVKKAVAKKTAPKKATAQEK